MDIDIELFIKNTCADISLLDRNLLLYFLNGFSYKLKADITVAYEDKSGDIIHMDCHDISGTSKASPNNFCRLFREINKVHEDKCLKCYEQIAGKYYDGIWNTPMIYCCHMGIWDMSYPLLVDDRLIGILFAGQIIVNGDMAVLREKLEREFDNEFYKYLCPTEGSQVSNIIDLIDQVAVDKNDFLKDLLSKDSQSYILSRNEEVFISSDTLASRYKDFREFGVMLTALFKKLHNLTVMNAQLDLLNEMSTKLSKATISTDIWWDKIEDVVSDFRRAVDLDHFEIYYRDKSFYIQKIGAGGKTLQDRAKLIPLDMVIGIPADQLEKLYEIPEREDLLSEFDFNRNTLLYRSEITDFENQNISTLLFVCNPSSDFDNINFTRMFCEMIALRTNISGIFDQMIKERVEYTKRVRRVSHYTKTMLHNSLSNIRQLRRNKQVNSVIREHLDNIEDNIKLAKLEMAELDMKSSGSKTREDLLLIIDDVVNIMTSWANERECKIEYQKPSMPVMINMNKAEIKIAVTNLLENSIKYSYAKHTIEILVSVPDESRAVVKFTNFGIGIPEEKIKKIREEGHIGEIQLIDRTNVLGSGSGLGLPIAIDFIESHNGSLNIRSSPSDNNERNPYQRYVTTVTITLPLYKERKIKDE